MAKQLRADSCYMRQRGPFRLIPYSLPTMWSATISWSPIPTTISSATRGCWYTTTRSAAPTSTACPAWQRANSSRASQKPYLFPGTLQISLDCRRACSVSRAVSYQNVLRRFSESLGIQLPLESNGHHPLCCPVRSPPCMCQAQPNSGSSTIWQLMIDDPPTTQRRPPPPRPARANRGW